MRAKFFARPKILKIRRTEATARVGKQQKEIEMKDTVNDKARELLAAGRTEREVSDELGIPYATVCKIVADAIRDTALRKFAEFSGR